MRTRNNKAKATATPSSHQVMSPASNQSASQLAAEQEGVALRLEGVSKRFGQFTAVDDVSLQIPKGAVYGFLGTNGAGKTTCIRMMMDIIRPSSGRVSVLGARSALTVRGRIGFLPEEKGLYKTMKAAAVIQYLAMLKGLSGPTARKRARSLLQEYGLGEFADSKVESLSKGMAQKVQVLATVAHDPELVIFDEPFSGLDPVNQAVLEDLIRDLAARGKTVVFSTHVMQHAERLCEQILLIAKGRKIFDGTVSAAKATIPRRVTLGIAGGVFATGGSGKSSKPGNVQGAISDIQGILKDVLGVNKVVADTSQDSQPNTSPEQQQARGTPAVDSSAPQLWQVYIDENADPQAILQRCFERGISLSRFEVSEPSLHDVFINMVGADAGIEASAQGQQAETTRGTT